LFYPLNYGDSRSTADGEIYTLRNLVAQ